MPLCRTCLRDSDWKCPYTASPWMIPSPWRRAQSHGKEQWIQQGPVPGHRAVPAGCPTGQQEPRPSAVTCVNQLLGPLAEWELWLVTRFSGFVRCCCYFGPPETCRRRNPEALSPAEMFVLTQFGRLQSRSRISLPRGPAVGPPALGQPGRAPTGAQGRGAGAAPPPCTGQGREPRVLPPKSPSAALKALQTASTGVSLLPEQCHSPAIPSQAPAHNVTQQRLPLPHTAPWGSPSPRGGG